MAGNPRLHLSKHETGEVWQAGLTLCPGAEGRLFLAEKEAMLTRSMHEGVPNRLAGMA
jgi:hypothetical protein